MAGLLTIAPFPAVTIDPHRDGDINWQLDPFGHPTWSGDFRSGGWIELLVSGYLAGGPGAQAYRARAKAITLSWLRGVPVSVRDPGTLICISEAFPGQPWIQDQIVSSVDYYAAHWLGAWNHGLKQDLELLRIGCGYPARAFGGAALRWRQTAVRQMIAAFEPNPLGPAIDTQGAVNEQATLYADFVYYLWQHGLPELAACGYRLPGWITARIARLPAFLGYATQPDGNLVQIGDSYVERPQVSPRPPHLVAVYPAGYVFGRSGWGPGASFYSLRFGPRRQVHGHNDHMSLTYYARPQPPRQRRAYRLREHALPHVPAVAGGEQRAGHTRRAVRPARPDFPGQRPDRPVRPVLRVLRHGLRREPAVPQRLRQPAARPGPGLRQGLRF
jgi:hypothetical protein